MEKDSKAPVRLCGREYHDQLVMSAMGTGAEVKKMCARHLASLIECRWPPLQECLPYQFWQEITQLSISFQLGAVIEKLSSYVLKISLQKHLANIPVLTSGVTVNEAGPIPGKALHMWKGKCAPQAFSACTPEPPSVRGGFFNFGCSVQLVGSQFPDQGLKPPQ